MPALTKLYRPLFKQFYFIKSYWRYDNGIIPELPDIMADHAKHSPARPLPPLTG